MEKFPEVINKCSEINRYISNLEEHRKKGLLADSLTAWSVPSNKHSKLPGKGEGSYESDLT